MTQVALVLHPTHQFSLPLTTDCLKLKEYNIRAGFQFCNFHITFRWTL